MNILNTPSLLDLYRYSSDTKATFTNQFNLGRCICQIALSVKHTQHHPNSSREKNQLRRFDIQDIQSYSIKCTRGLKVTHANNFLLFYRSESGLLEICLDDTHDVGHDEGFMI